MDKGKIIMGLGALMYYEKPKEAEGKPLSFEQLPKEAQNTFLRKAERVLQLLSKLNAEVVEAGTIERSKMADKEVKERLFGLLKANLSKMTHPKNLMDFLNDDVLRNISNNISEGVG